jgi:hypothetical protein
VLGEDARRPAEAGAHTGERRQRWLSHGEIDVYTLIEDSKKVGVKLPFRIGRRKLPGEVQAR